MGRHKKIIDYDQVEKLANIFCTQKEIATILNLSIRTLQRDKKFSRIYKKGLENAKMSLRRQQLKHAEKSFQMAIFLGKVYLGQSEEQIDPNRPHTVAFKFEVVGDDDKDDDGS